MSVQAGLPPGAAAVMATASADGKRRLRLRRLLGEVRRVTGTAPAPDPLWVYAAGPGFLWLGPDRDRSRPCARPLTWDARDRLGLSLLGPNLDLPAYLVAVYRPGCGELLVADATRVGAALAALFLLPAPREVRDKDEATRRLQYGVPAAEHRLGRLLPAVPGCGDIPYLSLSQARLERLVADTRRRVAKQRRWDARSAGRRSAGPENNLGAGAARNLVEVVRWVCGTLGADPAIRWNPAAELHAPGRRQHVPGFGADELVRIRGCLRHCRRDPDLDELVLDFALATGARKTAMIELRVGDLSLSRCAVRLYRKGGGTYWVPVRRSLLLDVLTHARARGAHTLDDPALLRRPRGGRPQQLTARYFDRLWDVVAAELVDAPVQPTTHRLRHTVIDRVFEGAGLKAAASFAGHTHPAGSGSAGSPSATWTRCPSPGCGTSSRRCSAVRGHRDATGHRVYRPGPDPRRRHARPEPAPGPPAHPAGAGRGSRPPAHRWATAQRSGVESPLGHHPCGPRPIIR